MILLKNINQILSLSSAHKKNGRSLNPDDLSVIEKGCIIYDQEVRFIGKFEDAPQDLVNKVNITKDLNGYVVTPEIIDSHTHLIFGGNRSKEYSMRLNGADYQTIAKAGGGIIESSRGTNSLSDEQLFKESCEKIERISSYGVGTIEIKSGYGLGIKEEYRLTKIIDRLKNHFNPKVKIINTFMAAHAVPKSFSSSSDYIERVCLPLLDKLSNEGIIDIIDIFHEDGYFNKEDVKLLFEKAKSLKIPVKSHADEFKDNSGASLAVSFNALSTDHLLCTSDDGIKALASSNTVATLLPGTGYFLGKEQANARKFLDSNVKVAIGSDYNPGSCHCDNVLLLASIAAPNYKMNICELWSSITLNAAHALGLKNQGALIKGMDARFSFFKTNTIDEITYNWGRNLAVEFDSI
ncbi:MAG: imidazolonepropionase [Halobacteriovorax sp.]|nr:imidazolonepropionase [Halobacteriovorax sp.]|tara:strand:+ start:314718 stop:315941 length:1224 start_codon:yes stop_codon:yes gene_type:complete